MKNKILLLLFSLICVALCSQNMMAQFNDNLAACGTVMDATIPTPPAQTSVCTDNSDNALTFADPTSSLPDIDFVVTVNNNIADINADGSFSADTLAAGDVVCVTAFTYDLASINTTLETANNLCPIIDCDGLTGIPGTNQLISDLVNGVNDGMPGLNSLQEALDFAGQFGGAVGTVADVQVALDAVNAQVGAFVGNICYATTAPVCFDVVVCAACPALVDIVVADSEVCSGGAFDVCFQFDGEVANTLTATANGIDIEGATGTEICVPVMADNQTCDLAPLDVTVGLKCEWFDVDVSAFVFAPLDVYPDPANFAIAVTPSAGCGEAPVIVDSTCPTLVEGWALGAPPAAGCTTDVDPTNDPENGDYIWTQDYTVYAWFADPFATNCVYPFDSDSENITGCEDVALCAGDGYCDNICFAEYNPAPTPDDFIDITLCVTPLGCADAPDASCLTTTACTATCETGDEVTVTETGEVCTACAADMTMGCTDPAACNYDPIACVDNGTCDFGEVTCPDPCDVVLGCTDATACNFDAAANCDDGTNCDYGDLTCPDPCNVVLGCTNATAPNFDPLATCDDGTCECTPDGCIDPLACNFDPLATCDDGTCDLGDATCPDPCNVVLGCIDPLACNYDPAATCNDGNCAYGEVTCPDPCNAIFGCTDPAADNYDAAANCDDGTCTFTNCADGSIAGIVTVDDDCDGTGGDAPTTPLTVELYDATGALIASVTTDATGNYLFDPVACGTYDVLVNEADLPPCSQGANPNPRVGVTVTDGAAVIAEDFAFEPIIITCSGSVDFDDAIACSVGTESIPVISADLACNILPEVINADGTLTVVSFDIYQIDPAGVNAPGYLGSLYESATLGTSACGDLTISYPPNLTCDPQVYTFSAVTAINTISADLTAIVDFVDDALCAPDTFSVTIYPSLTAVDVSANNGNCGDRQVDLVAEDGTVCDSQIQACVADGDVLDADFTGTAYDFGQGCSVLTASTTACDSSPLLIECVDIVRACESNSLYVVAPGADTSVDFPMPLAPGATWGFEWYLDGTLVGTNIGHPYYSPSATGTYTVIIYDYDTCSFWDACASYEVTEIIDCTDCD